MAMHLHDFFTYPVPAFPKIPNPSCNMRGSPLLEISGGGRFAPVLQWPPALRCLVQHGINVAVPLFGTKTARQVNRFIQYDPEWDFRLVQQLPGANLQYDPLYDIQVFPGPVQEFRQLAVQFVTGPRHAPEQQLEPMHIHIAKWEGNHVPLRADEYQHPGHHEEAP